MGGPPRGRGGPIMPAGRGAGMGAAGRGAGRGMAPSIQHVQPQPAYYEAYDEGGYEEEYEGEYEEDYEYGYGSYPAGGMSMMPMMLPTGQVGDGRPGTCSPASCMASSRSSKNALWVKFGSCACNQNSNIELKRAECIDVGVYTYRTWARWRT